MIALSLVATLCPAEPLKSLSVAECGRAFDQLWKEYVTTEQPKFQAEWENGVITIGDLNMKFEYRIFGVKPASGRDLYISMHGGGGTTKQVNDSQWRNQIGLYSPKQGVYVAPRAPTDTWDLWHQKHIDDFFARLIEGAVLCLDVNPDRVYIMGYSAGGDGVYQLAPRMADRLAAAAMMAGHPNETSPLGLRNIGFTIHVGELDHGYNRNKVALEWKQKLENLHLADPGGYAHKVVVHKGLGHWVNRQDAVALEWMAGFTRTPYPKKVVWKQDDVTHQQFYWLELPEDQVRERSEVVAEITGQTISLSNVKDITKLTILLNDKLVDMNYPVKVIFEGRPLFSGKVPRKLDVIKRTFNRRHDPKMLFCGEVEVELGK